MSDTSGVQLDLVSKERIESMGMAEKVGMILDRVSEGAVVVLEGGLTPDEESHLIERTMERTDGETFTGIEMDSYQRGSSSTGFFSRLVRGEPSKLTVVGPANKLHTLDKNETLLRTLVGTDD